MHPDGSEHAFDFLHHDGWAAEEEPAPRDIFHVPPDDLFSDLFPQRSVTFLSVPLSLMKRSMLMKGVIPIPPAINTRFHESRRLRNGKMPQGASM